MRSQQWHALLSQERLLDTAADTFNIQRPPFYYSFFVKNITKQHCFGLSIAYMLMWCRQGFNYLVRCLPCYQQGLLLAVEMRLAKYLVDQKTKKL